MGHIILIFENQMRKATNVDEFERWSLLWSETKMEKYTNLLLNDLVWLILVYHFTGMGIAVAYYFLTCQPNVFEGSLNDHHVLDSTLGCIDYWMNIWLDFPEKYEVCVDTSSIGMQLDGSGHLRIPFIHNAMDYWVSHTINELFRRVQSNLITSTSGFLLFHKYVTYCGLKISRLIVLMHFLYRWYRYKCSTYWYPVLFFVCIFSRENLISGVFGSGHVFLALLNATFRGQNQLNNIQSKQ